MKKTVYVLMYFDTAVNRDVEINNHPSLKDAEMEIKRILDNYPVNEKWFWVIKRTTIESIIRKSEKEDTNTETLTPN